MPSPDIDMEDIPEFPGLFDNDNDDNDKDSNSKPYSGEDSIKDGNCIFIMTTHCKAEFIQATSNISQRLAEAFHKNTQPMSFHESIPMHFHNFKDLFTKSSFDCLPNRK